MSQCWRRISLKSDVVCQSYGNVYRGRPTVFSWTRCRNDNCAISDVLECPARSFSYCQAFHLRFAEHFKRVARSRCEIRANHCAAAELESERRMLWDDVLPRLRTRIQSLDIQLIDIQHVGAGLMSPADCYLDGPAHVSHLDMISDCHRVSCGTFFLVSNFRQLLPDVSTNHPVVDLLEKKQNMQSSRSTKAQKLQCT